MISGSILVIIFLIALAGFFAGAETGIYKLSRLRLRLGIKKNKFSFLVLGKSLSDSSGLLLSTLLVTNLAHYLITSIVTYILLAKLHSEHIAELSATFLTAPVLFVFSELLPKSIFFNRADFLMPRIAPVLFAFYKLLVWCGIIPLLKFVSYSVVRMAGLPAPVDTAAAVYSSSIKAILQETQDEGFLSSVQVDITDRLTKVPQITVKSVMTPIEKVRMAEVNSDNSALLGILKEAAFTRLPVYDRWVENIVGFVNIYDCLSTPEQFKKLNGFVEPIRKLHADTTVLDAINILQKEKQKIILVTRPGHIGREKPIGIVTMKDLVEELFGELAEW